MISADSGDDGQEEEMIEVEVSVSESQYEKMVAWKVSHCRVQAAVGMGNEIS